MAALDLESFENEVRFRRADGQYRWHLCRGVPLHDDEGRIIKWYGILFDIDELKKTESALQEREHELLGIIDTIPSQFLEGLGLDGAFSRSMVSMKFWAKRWKSSISPNLRPASSASFSMVVLYNVVQLSLVAIAEYLKNIIDKNHQLATENMRLAAHAKKIATSTADQNEQLRMALQMKGKANQAGRLEKSNLSYQQLLGKLQNIYDLLSKWAVHIDFLDLAADWPTWVIVAKKRVAGVQQAYKHDDLGGMIAAVAGKSDKPQLLPAWKPAPAELRYAVVSTT